MFSKTRSLLKEIIPKDKNEYYTIYERLDKLKK